MNEDKKEKLTKTKKITRNTITGPQDPLINNTFSAFRTI